MKKTHEYIHNYRGYWSDGGKYRIRIYQEDGHAPVVICSQLPDNDNTSVTNMAEYLAAEVMEEHALPTPLSWVEHYPEHRGEPGEWSVISFSSWGVRGNCLGASCAAGWGAPMVPADPGRSSENDRWGSAPDLRIRKGTRKR
jgi:hypothetical protein